MGGKNRVKNTDVEESQQPRKAEDLAEASGERKRCVRPGREACLNWLPIVIYAKKTGLNRSQIRDSANEECQQKNEWGAVQRMQEGAQSSVK